MSTECYVCCDTNHHEMLSNICLCKNMYIHRKCQEKINTSKCSVCNSRYINVRIIHHTKVTICALKFAACWTWNGLTTSIGIPYVLWSSMGVDPITTFEIGCIIFSVNMLVFVCVVAYYRTLMCKKQESRVYSLPCSATP